MIERHDGRPEIDMKYFSIAGGANPDESDEFGVIQMYRTRENSPGGRIEKWFEWTDVVRVSSVEMKHPELIEKCSEWVIPKG